MRASEFQRVLRTQPFEPLRVHLSDGRSVLIRHPDQVVVSERYLYIGLGGRKSGEPATPAKPETITSDFVWVNLMQVTTVEPANGRNGKSMRSRKRTA
ncbi:MAG TPA: hypothetical protein P5572_21160 [Phycisphaerae bacterium]|nr:hypothetical protein [Phycisphaerae bacterium]